MNVAPILIFDCDSVCWLCFVFSSTHKHVYKYRYDNSNGRSEKLTTLFALQEKLQAV